MDSMATPYIRIQAKAVLVDQPEPLFWEVIPPPIYPRRFAKGGDTAASSPPQVKRITRPMKTISNPKNIYLKEVWTFSVMEHYLPRQFATQLDDILTGIASLDLGGNTRPIRKGLLFDMLRDLDEVGTATVMAYTDHGERHCQKLAGMARIAVNALNRLVDA